MINNIQTDGKKRKIVWDESVHDSIMKRPCECMGCNGCKTSSSCKKFGSNICSKCREWRCDLCHDFEKHMCKYDCQHYLQRKYSSLTELFLSSNTKIG